MCDKFRVPVLRCRPPTVVLFCKTAAVASAGRFSPGHSQIDEFLFLVFLYNTRTKGTLKKRHSYVTTAILATSRFCLLAKPKALATSGGVVVILDEDVRFGKIQADLRQLLVPTCFLGHQPAPSPGLAQEFNGATSSTDFFDFMDRVSRYISAMCLFFLPSACKSGHHYRVPFKGLLPAKEGSLEVPVVQ